MIVRIDQSLGVPIYQQVRDQVVAAIAAGELVEGDALPSVRALAVDLGINLHTVNKAYALLRDDGYLVVRGRAGAFVAKPMRTRDEGLAAEADKRLSNALAAAARDYVAAGGDGQAFLVMAKSLADTVFGTPSAPAGPKADTTALTQLSR